MARQKALLRKDIKQALAKQPGGAPCTVRQRAYIMYRLQIDLLSIKRLIPKLICLTPEILQKLIRLWQKNNNSINTVYRKIAVIRRVMRSYAPEFVFPSNKDLGIIYQFTHAHVTKKYVNPNEVIDKIAQKICYLQYYFGLKKIEAIQFDMSAIGSQGIWLTRAMAYNNKNRFIPIWSREQQLFLDKLMRNKSSSNNIISDKQIAAKLHSNELSKLGVEQEYYRHQYIVRRYHFLINECARPPTSALRQVRMEMGYRENRQIKSLLKCLNAL